MENIKIPEEKTYMLVERDSYPFGGSNGGDIIIAIKAASSLEAIEKMKKVLDDKIK